MSKENFREIYNSQGKLINYAPLTIGNCIVVRKKPSKVKSKIDNKKKIKISDEIKLTEEVKLEFSPVVNKTSQDDIIKYEENFFEKMIINNWITTPKEERKGEDNEDGWIIIGNEEEKKVSLNGESWIFLDE